METSGQSHLCITLGGITATCHNARREILGDKCPESTVWSRGCQLVIGKVAQILELDDHLSWVVQLVSHATIDDDACILRTYPANDDKGTMLHATSSASPLA